MKSISGAVIILLFVSITGCSKEEQSAKTAVETDPFKTQKEAIDKAEQVEKTVLDAANRQREVIDGNTQ